MLGYGVAVCVNFFFFFLVHVVASLSLQFFLVSSLQLNSVCTYPWVILGE